MLESDQRATGSECPVPSSFDNPSEDYEPQTHLPDTINYDAIIEEIEEEKQAKRQRRRERCGQLAEQPHVSWRGNTIKRKRHWCKLPGCHSCDNYRAKKERERIANVAETAIVYMMTLTPQEDRRFSREHKKPTYRRYPQPDGTSVIFTTQTQPIARAATTVTIADIEALDWLTIARRYEGGRNLSGTLGAKEKVKEDSDNVAMVEATTTIVDPEVSPEVKEQAIAIAENEWKDAPNDTPELAQAAMNGLSDTYMNTLVMLGVDPSQIHQYVSRVRVNFDLIRKDKRQKTTVDQTGFTTTWQQEHGLTPE